MMRYLSPILLLLVPVTYLADRLHWSPVAVTTIASLAIVPVAGLMGRATEHLSHRVGPTLGGFLNATFGNACELVIALIALRAGLLDVVKASITGSIIGNSLLVLGASMVAGGFKHKVQRFNTMTAQTSITLLTVVAFTLLIPAAMHAAHGGAGLFLVGETLALCISAVLILIYFLGLFFNLKTHKHLFLPVPEGAEDSDGIAHSWGIGKSLAVLLLSTLAVVFLSEHLVGSVEQAAESLGMSTVFVGVILLAIVGNAAEHSTAIVMAWKNKMDIAINIVFGSSVQIAMFVAPVLVFAGLAFGQPMDLFFTEAEVLAVVASVFVVSKVVQDGHCNWLEGVCLLGMYLILAICFYFAPAAL
jgi:Ca2+:H+ antiporter